MSAASVLSLFEAMVDRMESMASRLTGRKKIRPTRDQRDKFQELKKRLDAASAIVNTAVVELSRRSEKEIALVEDIRRTKGYQSITATILRCLRNNLALIFIGPKDSKLDTHRVTLAKRQTRTRCELLRSQHAHVILMWAMAFSTSTWTTSVGMTNTEFDFLIDDTCAERIPLVSPEILRHLRVLREEEPLNACGKFLEFMAALLESPPAVQGGTSRPSLKRSHGVESSPSLERLDSEQQQFQGIVYAPCNSGIYQLPSLRDMGFIAPPYSTYQTNGNGSHINMEPGGPLDECNQPQLREGAHQTSITHSGDVPAGVNLEPPSQKERGKTAFNGILGAANDFSTEVKYMYTNAPTSIIEQLPEPLKTAVQNSKQWRDERRRNSKTTGCLATLFPKDDNQDISLTIWCASKEAYRVNSIYGLELVISL
ncbi:hypothetical protein AJ80_04039 [Polytolypa hystricis UAMH7299]|uniref:Uncharacterized protein n=1 Tax=Polytolypa hystricis (strain UAMH7299) TaxID=1447883 RepID=A0A2B7YCN2_POLH7|nr:hypothetical protein AJ80_04039 [Polytolypa hystricis UAMH7299]